MRDLPGFVGELSLDGTPATGAEASQLDLRARDATMVYVHDAGNQPRQSVVKTLWDAALFGQDIGEGSRLASWVNRDLYPIDLPVRSETAEPATRQPPPPNIWEILTERLAGRPDGRESTQQLKGIADQIRGRIETDVLVQGLPAAAQSRLSAMSPESRKWLADCLARDYMLALSEFFFLPERRAEIERAVVERLVALRGPVVLVAHGVGSVVAYSALRNLREGLREFGANVDREIDLFITLGSALALDEVRRLLERDGPLVVPPCVRSWINFSDSLDPVSASVRLTEFISDGDRLQDYRNEYRNCCLNENSPQNPHDVLGYLRAPAIQTVVRKQVGSDFGQAVRRFVVAKDVVARAENAQASERQAVLIQLADVSETQDLDVDRQRLEDALKQIAGDSYEEAQVDPLRRFVAAQLTRLEIERLTSRFSELRISRVWRDLDKSALLLESSHTVQAVPARVSYNATGRDICWAVLDTGIAPNHPHFRKYNNIGAVWDCTKRGSPQPGGDDVHGHGTHVAGIIAGCSRPLKQPNSADEVIVSGIAPEARLHIYKVLLANGNGRDSFVIKALDHIAAVNERAGELVIHGINLSLGGEFDPTVYGCGHSAVCQELRRLWRQGVLVCISAGNNGVAMVHTKGGLATTNQEMSITDPANLDEAIAVGSTHKRSPLVYGISHFSSRGPTADGRRKPDLVAPGEQIISANARFEEGPWLSDAYVASSGTSMAAPHVSGVLCTFLSRRRGFIARPDLVKKILLENCTDLGRDPYAQGHGIPNLVNMLLHT